MEKLCFLSGWMNWIEFIHFQKQAFLPVLSKHIFVPAVPFSHILKNSLLPANSGSILLASDQNSLVYCDNFLIYFELEKRYFHPCYCSVAVDSFCQQCLFVSQLGKLVAYLGHMCLLIDKPPTTKIFLQNSSKKRNTLYYLASLNMRHIVCQILYWYMLDFVCLIGIYISKVSQLIWYIIINLKMWPSPDMIFVKYFTQAHTLTFRNLPEESA